MKKVQYIPFELNAPTTKFDFSFDALMEIGEWVYKSIEAKVMRSTELNSFLHMCLQAYRRNIEVYQNRKDAGVKKYSPQ